MTKNKPREKLYVIYNEKGEKVINDEFIKKRFKKFFKFLVILTIIVITIFSLGSKDFLVGLLAGFYVFIILLAGHAVGLVVDVFLGLMFRNKENTPNM